MTPEVREQRRQNRALVRGRLVALPLDGYFHATSGGYTNRFCRCEPCTEAANLMVLKWRADIGATTPLSEFSHGLNGYNNYSCRCPVCRAARAVYDAQRYSNVGSRKGDHGD